MVENPYDPPKTPLIAPPALDLPVWGFVLVFVGATVIAAMVFAVVTAATFWIFWH